MAGKAVISACAIYSSLLVMSNGLLIVEMPTLRRGAASSAPTALAPSISDNGCVRYYFASKPCPVYRPNGTQFLPNCSFLRRVRVEQPSEAPLAFLRYEPGAACCAPTGWGW